MLKSNLSNTGGVSLAKLEYPFTAWAGCSGALLERPLHQYRQKLRVRWSLESVTESNRPLADIAYLGQTRDPALLQRAMNVSALPRNWKIDLDLRAGTGRA
jgi:hypothetical protein